MSAKPAPKLPLADEFNQIITAAFCPGALKPFVTGRCKCGNQIEPGQVECRSCYADAKGPFEFSPEDYE